MTLWWLTVTLAVLGVTVHCGDQSVDTAVHQAVSEPDDIQWSVLEALERAPLQSVAQEPAQPPAQEPAQQKAKVPGRWETAEDGGRFFIPFVYSSTLTVFSITSITSTVPFTCISALTGLTTACTGRRRRRRRVHTPRALAQPQSDAPRIWSSLSERANGERQDLKDGRLVLTSWITVVSSYTSVSTVTTFDTTVSLDLLCSIGGVNYFPLCGGKK